MSARRNSALVELLPKFEISGLEKPMNLNQVLERDFVIIDFGSGMGTHALTLATDCPQVGVLAIDVHTAGLLAVVETAAELNLKNIRTHHGDGIDVIKGWLHPGTIDEVHLLFPDPWPKARHHKRRLIKGDFLKQVLPLLKPSGRVIFATDDASYFDAASIEFQVVGDFKVTFDDWSVPITTYHQRALRLGNRVQQLTARKT
jgi:tRNA (guanine-N7-)-methyltransferase